MNYEHARDAVTLLSDMLLRLVDELEHLTSDLDVERSRVRDLQREIDELKGKQVQCVTADDWERLREQADTPGLKQLVDELERNWPESMEWSR